MQAEKHSCTACIDKAQPFRYTEGRIEPRGIFHVLSKMRSSERCLRPFLHCLRRSDARTSAVRAEHAVDSCRRAAGPPGARAACACPSDGLYPCPDGLRPVAVLPVCRHCPDRRRGAAPAGPAAGHFRRHRERLGGHRRKPERPDAVPAGCLLAAGAADRHRRVVCCRGLQKPRRADLDRRAELPAHGGRLPHHLRGT